MRLEQAYQTTTGEQWSLLHRRLAVSVVLLSLIANRWMELELHRYLRTRSTGWRLQLLGGDCGRCRLALGDQSLARSLIEARDGQPATAWIDCASLSAAAAPLLDVPA